MPDHDAGKAGRRQWRRTRYRPAPGWLSAMLVIAAVGIGIAVLAGTGTLSAVTHWVRVHVLASGGIAAAAAVSAAILAVFQLRQGPRRAAVANKTEMLRLLRRYCWGVDERTGRLPKVGELTDPVELGVHPAAEISPAPLDGPQLPRNVPTYIERDIDLPLDAAIAQGGLILLTGDSTAGKSRAAYEAMRRLPADTAVLVPTELESLQKLVDNGLMDPSNENMAGIRPGDAVIWLNDLERFFGPNGLNVRLLRSLTGSHGRKVIVLATMRASEYLKRLASLRQAGWGREYQPTQTERELLEQAKTVSLERRFSQSEIERATKKASDPRIKDALAHREEYGLAEYMAAGPSLWHLWRVARSVDNPDDVRVGAAIVAAALDSRRAGLAKPIPVALLRELYPVYLEKPRASQLDADAFQGGLSWADEPVQATSALLSAADSGYEIFDYLLDKLQADPSARAVPDVVWTSLLAGVEPSDSWGVGIAAYWANRLTYSEQAFRLGLRSSDEAVIQRSALGMAGLARLLDQFRESDQWAWRAKHPGDMPKDADQRSRLGARLETASEDWFRRIAEAGGDPTRRLVIDYEHTALNFDGTQYHYRKTMRSLSNQTAEVIDRYPFRLAVDRYPGDPKRSEEQYRVYPLTVASADIKAWHDDKPMDWEVEYDSPSFKDLWLLFRNKDEVFPLLPGESCSITYQYTVSDKHWGPWLKRKVRIPTRKASSEISFPTILAPELTGSEILPSSAPTPLAITEHRDADRTLFTWETTDPPLNAQYFFEWRFRQDPKAACDAGHAGNALLFL